jgi:hypothetical protein
MDRDPSQEEGQQPKQARDDSQIHSATEHGTTASHPTRRTQTLLCSPTTEYDFNAIGMDLVPVACLSLNDRLFDLSFRRPEVAIKLQELDALRRLHGKGRGPNPPISIFSHAVGTMSSGWGPPGSSTPASSEVFECRRECSSSVASPSDARTSVGRRTATSGSGDGRLGKMARCRNHWRRRLRRSRSSLIGGTTLDHRRVTDKDAPS